MRIHENISGLWTRKFMLGIHVQWCKNLCWEYTYNCLLSQILWLMRAGKGHSSTHFGLQDCQCCFCALSDLQIVQIWPRSLQAQDLLSAGIPTTLLDSSCSLHFTEGRPTNPHKIRVVLTNKTGPDSTLVCHSGNKNTHELSKQLPLKKQEFTADGSFYSVSASFLIWC